MDPARSQPKFGLDGRRSGLCWRHAGL